LRLQEAARLAFSRAVVPKGSGLAKAVPGLEILECSTVAEALVRALGSACVES
jgi:DNA repair protein RadA/Sms